MIVVDAGAIVSVILGVLALLNVMYQGRHSLIKKLRSRRLELERQASITTPVRILFTDLFSE